MKKIITLIIAVSCVLSLTACGKGSAGTDPAGTVEMKEGQTVQTVVDKIADEVGVAMPSDLDSTVLNDLFHIPEDAVEEFAGKIAIVNVSADNVVAIKAKEGKIDVVKEGLEKRLEDVRKSFEGYLPEQFEKTQKGQVVVKGNYAFLLVLGESVETFDEDMNQAVAIIDGAFQA